MQKEPKNRSTVLVVDDMPENVEVLSESLVDDYDVKVALSGKDALALVMSASPPDLILLDIIMPEMDGYEVCRQLKQNAATADIPVIFVTVMDEMDDETKGFDVGGVDYITKPICVPIVRARVRAHLELRKAREDLKEKNKILMENLRLREDVESIVRHDLKTPLSVFLWATDLLSMEPNLSDTQERSLCMMKQAIHTMTQTLNSSINIIKMERGEYTLNPEPVDVIRILTQVMSDMYGLMTSKKLGFHIFLNGSPVSETDTFVIQGEKLLFYTMMANLLKNAMEASPEGQIVAVYLDEKDTRTIRVHNQGVIPENIRHVFFEKYITSNKKLGSGLGTYSARLMARTQNGNISFTTSEALGTDVTVAFPK